MKENFILCRCTPNGEGLPDETIELAICTNKEWLTLYCKTQFDSVVHELNSLGVPIRPNSETWKDYYKIIPTSILIIS